MIKREREEETKRRGREREINKGTKTDQEHKEHREVEREGLSNNREVLSSDAGISDQVRGALDLDQLLGLSPLLNDLRYQKCHPSPPPCPPGARLDKTRKIADCRNLCCGDKLLLLF